MNTPTHSSSMAAELKKEITALQQKKFIGLNNEQIFSYVHVYNTVYTFIAANALDEEYGDRKIFSDKLHTLLKIQIRRYKKATDLLEKIKLIDAILYTLEFTSQIIESEEYWNEGAALIEEYMTRHADPDPDETELFYVMHLILNVWYGLVEDDENDTPASLTYARKKISEWASALSKDGSWNNLSDVEGLRRFTLMSINSSRMLNDTYDEQLTAAHDHYCNRAFHRYDGSQPIDGSTIDKYTLLYYALLQSPMKFPSNLDKLTKVSNILAPQIPHLQNEPLRHTLCQNIHTDNMCMLETDRIQRELDE